MSGTGETNGEAVPIKENEASNQPPTNGDESHQDDLLLSHIVPTSHILADGRFIQLPPPSALERSAFFERAVAAHRLISIDGDEKEKSGGKTSSNKKKRPNDDDDGDAPETATARDGKKKKKSAADAPFVHPLAIASARLRAKGMDELSKAINLGGLIIGGEYFGLSNVVNQRLSAKKDNASDAAGPGGGEKVGKDHNGEDVDPSSTVNGTSDGMVDESIMHDQRLRSKYVLRRRQSQYDNASTVLSRHEKRLSSSISVMRILDTRLQSLRKRWRLVAPEHGTRTVGPVRPREVVAIDVEIYDRDRLGGGSRANNTDNSGHSMGRIARRVPRFATLELDDNYDVSVDIQSLRKNVKEVINGLKKLDDDAENGGISADMKVEHGIENKPKEQSTASSGTESCKTKAEPFAIADPTLGKIDPDFDPDKVPLLTLLFEIEKPSTGFVERATLSSSFVSSANGGSSNNSDGKRHLHPDERVIEALQHSLFCASLFESMRAEIIPSSTQSNVGAASSQQRQKSVAWLSSEMEESFLPPPSVMAGEDTGLIGDTRLLCVIHCHEGEVKVQLDDEYSLTVKLIEAGTAAAAGTDNSSTAGTTMTIKQPDDCSTGMWTSGSQSPAQLRTLCRALLLQSQSLYHEHCTKTRMGSASDLAKKQDKPAVGFARTKKEVKPPSPHILQSCVGLGCKFIFEKKVRIVLKRLSQWLEKEMSCNDKIIVDWLPLALFDSNSRFALLFREICLDIGIDGDVLRVTRTSEHGEFRAVAFGSELELECFLKLEFRRALAND
eukprot:CAMPEP_0172317842 /NCGR_PEP_ID=MMETSP1058-20130122/33011_1 /TAXON_ID=83371 /ORGANISM="Detonula confervacea, Strain CCMP 353" /LENGTH=782 /DNA_ID=CAMNT_0013032503 /DNA_START=97 /DNA_END=2445 /DNA_ORIENTATION=-